MQNSTQDGRIECSRLRNGSLTGSVTIQALQRALIAPLTNQEQSVHRGAAAERYGKSGLGLVLGVRGVAGSGTCDTRRQP
jgi:hypothetical protein